VSNMHVKRNRTHVLTFGPHAVDYDAPFITASPTFEQDSPLVDVIHQRAALIREPNEVRILRVVRDAGEISRIEIAKLTGLHKTTITDLVGKLIRAGFLEETGAVDRAGKWDDGGYPSIQALAGLVAGVDIGMTHAVVALTDLNAHILQQKTFQYRLTPQQRKSCQRSPRQSRLC